MFAAAGDTPQYRPGMSEDRLARRSQAENAQGVDVQPPSFENFVSSRNGAGQLELFPKLSDIFRLLSFLYPYQAMMVSSNTGYTVVKSTSSCNCWNSIPELTESAMEVEEAIWTSKFRRSPWALSLCSHDCHVGMPETFAREECSETSLLIFDHSTRICRLVGAY